MHTSILHAQKHSSGALWIFRLFDISSVTRIHPPYYPQQTLPLCTAANDLSTTKTNISTDPLVHRPTDERTHQIIRGSIVSRHRSPCIRTISPQSAPDPEDVPSTRDITQRSSGGSRGLLLFNLFQFQPSAAKPKPPSPVSRRRRW